MFRKLWIVFSILLMGSGLVFSADPEVVSSVDLNLYQGKWYEIARFPNAFQSQGSRNVIANYTIRSDGLIGVDNSCLEKNGTVSRVNGVARIDDQKTRAKLGVSFFDILGYRPIWGDYWILGLGKNYSYSVVGDRSRKYAWILSRTPKLPDRELAEARAVLDRNGYDSKRLEYTIQVE